MNIDKDAVLRAFKYFLLEEVNYEDLPQEWLDVREKMIPVLHEAFCCGCEFIEKKILEEDESDFIDKKGEYSKIQVKHSCGSMSPFFEELMFVWDTWLEFEPYDSKLFKGTMVINSKDYSMNLIIELPEEKAIGITVKGNIGEDFIGYGTLLYYNDSWKEDRIFCDEKKETNKK